jgi:glutamate dehydrogenase/leucine dehydrogenase
MPPGPRPPATSSGSSSSRPPPPSTRRATFFAPCAQGGAIDERAAARLRARAVVGSANSPLASEAAGLLLHGRGIVFAPDEISGTGALLLGAAFHLEARRPGEAEIARRVGELTEEILTWAAQQGLAPFEAAARRALLRLRERAAREDLNDRPLQHTPLG